MLQLPVPASPLVDEEECTASEDDQGHQGSYHRTNNDGCFMISMDRI